MFLATLILNWNEDGKIYKERLQEKEDAPPPLNLNPWIRGFRLAFVLLFVGFDVGMIIYNKVSYDQSHYREVARWEIFMEQELRFGLDLGRFGNF